MSSSSSLWIWDQARGQHYYCSYQEGFYVYENGIKIPMPPQNSNQQHALLTHPQPPYSQPSYSQPTYSQPAYSQPTYTQSTNSQSTFPQSSNTQWTAQSWPQIVASRPRLDSVVSQPYLNSGYQSQSGPQSPPQQGSLQSLGALQSQWHKQEVELGPEAAITDPDLYKRQIVATAKLNNNFQPQQTLDPAFVTQQSPKPFFVFGKVFKCLWPEHVGNAQDKLSIFTGTFDETFVAKVRWFVVIKEG
ncbi:hypothetical protein EJ08DRAFT_612651, partial [Tothia fuscella]